MHVTLCDAQKSEINAGDGDRSPISGVNKYIYATAAQSGYEADGWLSEDGTGLADVDFEPGLGILVDTADGATVTIPGVDL